MKASIKQCSNYLNHIGIWVWIISYEDVGMGMVMLTYVFVFVRNTVVKLLP